MTKKSQMLFIIFVMLSLVLAFIAIFLVIAHENLNVTVRESQASLNFLEKLYEENSFKVDFRQKFFVAEVYAGGAINVTLGENNFSEEEKTGVINKAQSKDYEYGSYENIFYKRVYSDGKLTVYAADMSEKVAANDGFLVKVALAILIILAVVFLIVWGISVKIFSPIKQTLIKQRRFISDASHELKTPLAIISANTEVLSDSSVYVKSIKKQVERLDFLVEDLLTLARMDEGNNNIIKEEFCVSEEVADTALTFDALAYEKKKRFVCDITPNLFYNGDKNGLKSIVGILSDNAIKYSIDNGDILLTLKRNGKQIVLKVINEGSNVPDQLSDRIFERFFRDDSRSRESGGNGLGLSIAKNIATINKWNISAESVYGKSMTVTLIL